MKLTYLIIIITFLAIVTSSKVSKEKGIFNWLLGSVKRAKTPEADRLNILGELAYFSHELIYEKTTDAIESKNGDNLYDYLVTGNHVENGGFKSSWGVLERDPTYAMVVFRGTENFKNFKTDVKTS